MIAIQKRSMSMATSGLTHQHIPIGDSSLHIVEAGQDHPESLVFLHGWPEDWTEWKRIMEQARKTHHVIALDLPGIGESHGAVPGGENEVKAVKSWYHDGFLSEFCCERFY
jgi:pimeloyl-ACP methyl ester carboxylesterase